jgi:hypothetical protein
MITLIQGLIELGFLAATLVLLVLTFKDSRTHRRATTEFYDRLQQTLSDQDHARRWAERKILQALKGENYSGDWEGFEIYSDPAVPPGYVISIPPKKVAP